MPLKKWSELDPAAVIQLTDDVMGLVGADNARISIELLKIFMEANISTLGDITVDTIVGDGSGLTGFGGTGGIINTGSTTIGADSDVSGVGVIALQTRGVTRVTVENLGDVTFAGNIALGANDIAGGTATFTNLAGTLTTAAQVNVTSVGKLSGLQVVGATKMGADIAPPSALSGVLDLVSTGASGILTIQSEGTSDVAWFVQTDSNNARATIGTFTNSKLRLVTNNTPRITVEDGGKVVVGAAGVATSSLLTNDGTISLKEQASANADTAGYGQFWVKNTTPCEFWVTDDAGNDYQLATVP